MWFLKKFKLCKPAEEGDTGGGAADTSSGGADAGGMDMGSALDSISGDLFPAEEGGDDLGNGDPVEPAAPAASADTKTPGTPPTDPAAAPAATAPAKTEAPNTWRPEAKAEWDKIPPTVQAEIQKREQDVFKGIEGYRQQAEIGQTFASLVGPYQQVYEQNNLDPVALTKDLLQFHAELTVGNPQQKLAKVQQIAQMYGVDLSGLGAPGDEPPYVDPQVKALQDQLAAVQSQLSGTTAEQQRIRQAEEGRLRATLHSEVDAFANDPANIYFSEVEGMIPQILKSGQAKSLKEAYDIAVKLNPVTFQKEVDRTAAERLKKIQDEARAKAKTAQSSAAANVRTSAKQAGGTTLLGSIDDTLKEAYQKLNAPG